MTYSDDLLGGVCDGGLRIVRSSVDKGFMILDSRVTLVRELSYCRPVRL